MHLCTCATAKAGNVPISKPKLLRSLRGSLLPTLELESKDDHAPWGTRR